MIAVQALRQQPHCASCRSLAPQPLFAQGERHHETNNTPQALFRYA